MVRRRSRCERRKKREEEEKGKEEGKEVESLSFASALSPSHAPGFAAIVQMMRPGDRWECQVPPYLAYGPQGKLQPNGDILIPPNASLQFDIHLKSVVRIPEGSVNNAWKAFDDELARGVKM